MPPKPPTKAPAKKPAAKDGKKDQEEIKLVVFGAGYVTYL